MIQRKRIGDILREEGRVTEEQIQIALQEQKKTGELLGAILFSHGFITQQDLFRVLSLTHTDTGTPKTQDDSLEVPEEIESLVKQSSIVFQTDSGLERKHVDSAQSPLVRLVDKIIITGIKQNATDVHVGPDARGTRVRYRVDGALHHGMLLPRNLLNPIISRFKILGHMNIAESRVPQDGSAEFLHKDKKLDLRISTFPLINGENIVARILDKSHLKLGLDTLGFKEADIQLINETLKLPFGMILVTGPTGSGKTTTLYSCLSIINTVSRNIFTVEDPVEYQIPLVRQSQVNVKAGLTFATGLRSILRQDPDIILVGEMRDLETAELAVRAALTGHLVFSTLHTNDAASSLVRLVDMGIEPFLISSTLDTVIAQRLVRNLCPACREALPAQHVLYGTLAVDPRQTPLYRAKGCDECRGTGYRGRSVIYEILKVTAGIRDLINRRVGLDDIKRLAVEQGFKDMYENGLDRVRSGSTTIEEISTVTRTGT
ncbi:MAG: ATPase, T2SS/T4P/T4SS family [Nitrospirota bacterium]|mgnify:CR=1 FL=1